MNNRTFIFLSLFVALILASNSASAQNSPGLVYYNADSFRIINKGFEDTELTYSRLPLYLKDSVRTDLWNRGLCSSGIGIRFSSNSKKVAIKYTLLWDFHMNHMADTGIKGADLYLLEKNGVWRYVNSVRPKDNNKELKQNEKVLVDNLDGNTHEFLIYLPLYDGVTEMYIGVDSAAILSMPTVDNPRKSKKIVMYGTSVLQGGCASRTGMVATNIIQRELNCEVINLGFSGEGKMDSCIARAIGSISDIDAIVIDPVPNCTEKMCDTLTFGFVDILAKLCPDIPIIMVEGAIYTYAEYDSFFNNYLPKKNEAYYNNYKKLKRAGHKNIIYVSSDNLYGSDGEGTVDGIHFTDYGFRKYADKLIKVLRPIIK